MPNYLPFDLDWIRVVIVYSAIVFVISTAILIPSLKLLTPPRLSRLPNWLRWVLVLPMAFFVGQIAETVPRLLFATIEIIINHHLTFKPGFNCLTWQAYSPIFFVIGGMLMAPSHRVAVLLTLDALKIAVAIFNLHTTLSFINRGGRWERLDPILNSPLWWNASVYVLCIILLILTGIYFVARERKKIL